MAQQLIVAQRTFGSSEAAPRDRAGVHDRVGLMFLRMAGQVRWTTKSATAVGMGAGEAYWAPWGLRSNRVIDPSVGG